MLCAGDAENAKQPGFYVEPGCPLAGISSLCSDIPHRLRRVVLIKRKRALKANFRALFLFISGERGIRNPGTVTRTSV